MQVLKKGLYLLVYLVYCTPSGNCQSSACSRFINYYGSGGTLYIDPPSDSTVLDLSAEFTVAVHIKAKDFGELALVENSDALLRRLQRNDASPIQYSVRFPISSPKPYLTTLTLNNKILCRDTAQNPPLYTKLNLHYKWFSDVPVILKNTGYQESNPPQQYQQQNFYNRPSYYESPITTRAPFTCPPPPLPQKCYCPAPVQTTCPPPPPCYCPEPTRATCPPPEPPKRCYCPATTKPTCPPPPPPPRCSCPEPPPPPPAAPCKNNDNSEDNESQKYKFCGESPVQATNLVYDGTTTANGRYPWVTAIYHVGKQGINFQCGGTLVTAKHTVTAAHCVINEATNQVITDKVVVFLDRYEVLRFNDNAIAPQIAQITIHPDYRYGKITDLAIITFKTKVKFGPYIKPICLWNTQKEETEFFPSGQIVGWGRNDYGEISNKPKEAEMTILQKKECLQIGGFEDILTNNSFCAKKAEGDRGGSPCNGDSGGGFYVRSKQGGRWYLRGVISKALVDNNKRCFPQKPAAFADVSSRDVLQWMEWMMHKDGADPLPDS